MIFESWKYYVIYHFIQALRLCEHSSSQYILFSVFNWFFFHIFGDFLTLSEWLTRHCELVMPISSHLTKNRNFDEALLCLREVVFWTKVSQLLTLERKKIENDTQWMGDMYNASCYIKISLNKQFKFNLWYLT